MTRLESFYILDLARPISHEGTGMSKRGTWSTVDHILADPQGTTASAIESGHGYRDCSVRRVTCEETAWSSSCGFTTDILIHLQVYLSYADADQDDCRTLQRRPA
jgi:hypothetical protein